MRLQKNIEPLVAGEALQALDRLMSNSKDYPGDTEGALIGLILFTAAFHGAIPCRLHVCNECMTHLNKG